VFLLFFFIKRFHWNFAANCINYSAELLLHVIAMMMVMILIISGFYPYTWWVQLAPGEK